jgi:outer membrane protein assembly factor BamB
LAGYCFFYVAFTAFGCLLLAYWLLAPVDLDVALRVPIPENHILKQADSSGADLNLGTLIAGSGKPSEDPGSWPQFRGTGRDAIANGIPVAPSWPEKGPRILWTLKVGEGHAGAAILNGCVYLLDYDEGKKEDVIRCISFENGEEIWRYSYSVKVKRNHGMSRTVPAVTDDFVVTLGPQCHVYCLNAKTGELVWKKDLVEEYGTRVPEWYAGQCPLIESGQVILAPGGRCLMTAVDLATGEAAWETPNEQGWQMTHASILPIEFDGKRQYVWCASGGAVGVEAETGDLLWELPEWSIKIATVPSPLDLGEGRIFFSGGYNAGGMMVQLRAETGGIQPQILFRTDAKEFGSDQQTPVYHGGAIVGVIPGGKLACLSLEGEQVWVEETYNFGLGPYMMVDEKLLVLDDNEKKPGELCLFEISTSGVEKLAGAAIVQGHDAWAPLAFAGGKLVMRDSTTLYCLDLKER